MNGFQYFPFQVILFSLKDLCFFKFEILPRWNVMEGNPTILHIIWLKIWEVPFAWSLVLLNLFSELSFGVTNILEFLVIGRYWVHNVGRAPNIGFRSSFKQKIPKGCGFLVDTVDVERFFFFFFFFGKVCSSNLNSSWDEGIEALFFMPEHLAHPK